MLKRIPYSLWKNHYRQYPADQFWQTEQTILVDLPEVKSVKWPDTWKLSENCYCTPGGCSVYLYNSGLAESFRVERIVENHVYSRIIHPGLNSRELTIKAVEQLEIW